MMEIVKPEHQRAFQSALMYDLHSSESKLQTFSLLPPPLFSIFPFPLCWYVPFWVIMKTLLRNVILKTELWKREDFYTLPELRIKKIMTPQNCVKLKWIRSLEQVIFENVLFSFLNIWGISKHASYRNLTIDKLESCLIIYSFSTFGFMLLLSVCLMEWSWGTDCCEEWREKN